MLPLTTQFSAPFPEWKKNTERLRDLMGKRDLSQCLVPVDLAGVRIGCWTASWRKKCCVRVIACHDSHILCISMAQIKSCSPLFRLFHHLSHFIKCICSRECTLPTLRGFSVSVFQTHWSFTILSTESAVQKDYAQPTWISPWLIWLEFNHLVIQMHTGCEMHRGRCGAQQKVLHNGTMAQFIDSFDLAQD